MNVVVLGPNLVGKHQEKGYMHVHREACGDLSKYAPGDAWPVMGLESERAVIEEVFSDFIFANDEQPWTDFEGELWFAPCVQLPKEKT